MIFLLILLPLVANLVSSVPVDRKSRSSVCPSFAISNKLCTSNPLYPYFSTKTTYTESYKYLKSLGLQTEQLPSGYKPVLFYYFGRHGIRYPAADDIEALNALSGNITELIEKADDKASRHLCKDVVGKVKSFRSHWLRNHDNHVTGTGSAELEGIGERYKKLLPSILDPSKDGFSIEVGVSDKIRTTESASGFVKGLYGGSYDEKSNLHTVPRYDVTLYHKACRDARSGIKPEKHKVIKKFRKETILTEMMAEVLGRLGLPPDHMKFKDFKMLHELCSYNHAINGSSVWCTIFTTEDLKLLEYFDDINDYYSVHNDKALKRAPCAIMKELLSVMEKTTKNQNPTKAFLRFSHSGAIRPFLAYLGLFDNFGSDQEKDHTNYCVNGRLEREWRTSLIAPFAANVAFILLKKDFESDYKVLTLVQEVPVKVEGCKKVLCSLDDFKDSFSKSAKKCDVHSICSKGGD